MKDEGQWGWLKGRSKMNACSISHLVNATEHLERSNNFFDVLFVVHVCTASVKAALLEEYD